VGDAGLRGGEVGGAPARWRRRSSRKGMERCGEERGVGGSVTGWGGLGFDRAHRIRERGREAGPGSLGFVCFARGGADRKGMVSLFRGPPRLPVL
jgi:hypothetical protein